MQFDYQNDADPPFIKIYLDAPEDEYRSPAYIDWNDRENKWKLSGSASFDLYEIVEIARYMSALEKPE